MGKPSVQALPAERWRGPAWLAAHWLASSCRLRCRLCEQLLTRASRFPVCKDCLASFSRIRGDIRGEYGVPVSGDDHEGGPAVARNSTSIERGVLHGTRVRCCQRAAASDRVVEICRAGVAGRLVCGPAGRVGENREALEADVIVPVPRHKIRRRERGFNRQRRCQIDLRSDLRCRTKECFG
jgi:hypothetical protein